MKITLFDLKHSGHHIEFIRHIVRYCKKKGDQITFITWNESDQLNRLPAQDRNFQIEYVNRKNQEGISGGFLKRNIQYLKGLNFCLDFAESWGSDTIHFMYLDRVEIPLFFILMVRGSKVDSNVFANMISPYFWEQNKGSFSLRGVYHKLNELALRKSLLIGLIKKLFVLSKKTRKLMMERWPNLDREKIVSVPDPIVPFAGEISQKRARNNLDLPQDGKVLLYFGGLRKVKGVEVLLKAFALLNTEKNLYLVIAGDGSPKEKGKVKSWKEGLNNPANLITRLQFIPDKDIENYFVSSDVVILPYRKDYTGTSGILQNAAAAGRPVIASHVGQIGSIIDDWGLGVTVEPEEPERLAKKIKIFLEDEDKKTKIKKITSRYTKKHHWTNMASIIRTSYGEVKS